MTTEELELAADLNLSQGWAAIAGGLGPDAVRRASDLLACASGLPHPFFNPWFPLTRSVSPEGIDELEQWYQGRGLLGLGWVREGSDPALVGELDRRGIAALPGPPCMLMPDIPEETPAPPAGLEIRRVDDASLLADAAVVLKAGFEMDDEAMAVLANPAQLDLEDFALFVGYLDGRPVASATISISNGLAGLYSVTTLPEMRGRGLGSALSWAAVAEGRDRGMSSAVLQSSELGMPVYAAMGFEPFGHYTQYVLGEQPAS